MAETVEKQRRDVRTTALYLAVETVKNARNYTNFQVVATASLYEAYIWDAVVPGPPQAPAEEQEADDEPV